MGMVDENIQKNKRQQWKKQVMNNLKRDAFKNIIAGMGDLARLDAKVNNTYTVYIKIGRLIKQRTNGKCVGINGKIQGYLRRNGEYIFGERDIPFLLF